MIGRWLGIDFSGNYRMWQPACGTSNVWIAVVEQHTRLYLTELFRVQSLPGTGRPLERLISYLTTTDYRAAGIDAPFSIPMNRPTSAHLRRHAWIRTNALVPRPSLYRAACAG